MSWLGRLKNHLRQSALSKEIAREMRFHLAEREDDLVARGMMPDAARREARRRFGSLAYQGELTRERNLFAWLDSVVTDVRYALRALGAAPAFTTVAVLSLALGIGANTAIFSVIDALVLKSLPVSHPEELVSVLHDTDNPIFTNPLWEAIRDREDMFSGIFAYGTTSFNLTSGGEAQRVEGNTVSGDYFATLGVRPVAGRLVDKKDDYRGCPGLVVLSEGFWDTRYSGDPGAIGKTLSLDGHPFQIIGVADGRFSGLSVGERPQLFVPICSEKIIMGANSQLDERSSWYLQITGRPRPGLTATQVNARLATLAPGIVAATIPPNWPADALAHYRKTTFTIGDGSKGFSFTRMMYEKALYILMAIVGLVLLIACANVANLLLARAAVRQREMAVRLALGAARGRLVRQLITESLLLSSFGAMLGIAFAIWGSRGLVRLLSSGERSIALDLGIDSRVLVFTIFVATLTGLLFGLVPAWRAGRVDPQSAMKAHGRGVTEGHSRFRMGKALVAIQVAMSLVLIVGAALLIGSWRRLTTEDPGFQRRGILLVHADFQNINIPRDQRLIFSEQLLNAVQSLPGVQSASGSQITPVGNNTWNDVFRTEAFTAKSEDDATSWVNPVSDGYFRTLGIPVLAGRDFDQRDSPVAPRVAIVNEAMAKHFFGSPAALGRHFQRQEGSSWSAPIEVVGIVGTTKYHSMRDSAQPIVYFPRSQLSPEAQQMSIEIRTSGMPTGLVPTVTKAITKVNPRITLDITTLEQQVSESLALARAIATLSGFFGALAMVLATIGLYGIMTYTVARRRNEIGVRIALGAEQARVVRMVLGEVLAIVIVGVVLGVALSVGTTRLATAFLYGVRPTDPATLTAAVVVLTAVGVAAAALPAWRASRLDPVAALREE
ncbi:MAG TPA: ABC transporter permease [Gemmatimonadaceae bacterium]